MIAFLKKCNVLSSYIYLILIPVPFILGELRDSTASVGFKRKYPGDLVHFTIFKNKTSLFVKIESSNFQNLRDF